MLLSFCGRAPPSSRLSLLLPWGSRSNRRYACFASNARSKIIYPTANEDLSQRLFFPSQQFTLLTWSCHFLRSLSLSSSFFHATSQPSASPMRTTRRRRRRGGKKEALSVRVEALFSVLPLLLISTRQMTKKTQRERNRVGKKSLSPYTFSFCLIAGRASDK